MKADEAKQIANNIMNNKAIALYNHWILRITKAAKQGEFSIIGDSTGQEFDKTEFHAAANKLKKDGYIIKSLSDKVIDIFWR